MNLKNAILQKVQTMADGSLKIVLNTREMSPEQMAQLFYHVNKEIVSVDIPDETQRKTKGQRLRGVLHVLWENDPERKEKYETSALHYDSMMEKIIEHYREMIPDDV